MRASLPASPAPRRIASSLPPSTPTAPSQVQRARRALDRPAVGRVAAALALATALGLALVGGATAAASVHSRAAHRGWVDHTNVVLGALDAIADAVGTAESTQRGYLLTGDPSYLARGGTAPNTARAALARARWLTRDNPAQQRRLAALVPVVDEKLAELAATVAQAAAGDRAGALRVVRSNRGELLARAITANVGAARAAERDLLAVRTAAEAADAARTERGLAAMWLGTAVLVAGGGTLLRREGRRARTALQTLQAREVELREVLTASPDCVMTLDLAGHVLTINTAGVSLLELDGADALIGAALPVLFAAPTDQAAVTDALADARAGHRGHVQAPCPTARGTPKWWDVAVTPIPGPDGVPARLLCVSREITALKRAEEALRALSDQDELTGLLNRRGFRPLAEQALRLGRRTGTPAALLAVDLDHFKPINDTHGHAAGDAALRAVARVLRDTVREGDIVGRLGGDEFAVYATGLTHADEGHVLVARLQTALGAHNAAATAAGRPYAVSFSVGVAEVAPGDTLADLLARADAACYAAKLTRPGSGPRMTRG